MEYCGLSDMVHNFFYVCIYLFSTHTLSFVRLSAKESWFSNRCNLREALHVEWAVDVILPGFWNIKNALVSRLRHRSGFATRKVLASYSPFVCSLVKRKKKPNQSSRRCSPWWNALRSTDQKFGSCEEPASPCKVVLTRAEATTGTERRGDLQNGDKWERRLKSQIPRLSLLLVRSRCCCWVAKRITQYPEVEGTHEDQGCCQSFVTRSGRES